MPPILRHKNGILYLDNSPLQYNAVAETYLTAEGTAAASTITVKNIIGFGINQILMFEELGNDNAEIILTHASTTPTGTTVTLASALVKTHAVGSRVRVITYNQFELSRGTTTVAASGTVLTVATTANFNPVSALGTGLVAVDPTQKIQVMESSEHTSGYYFARYKNSITSDFSGYTDALIYGGWSANTVGNIVDRALKDAKAELSASLTKDDCYQWITDGMREIEGKQVRWPDHYSFHQILGQTSRGNNVIAMPTDAYDTESNKSLLSVSIGDNDPLMYVDPIQFEVEMTNTIKTQVRTQAVATDTTLAIDNSYDFADSGTVHVYVSGTKYDITYTGVTRSATTGILTGIPASGTGSITVTLAVDVYVWQNETEGIPRLFTVRNSNIEYWPLADASEDNQNVYSDYAKIATTIDTDGDTIDFQRYDLLQRYLTWRVWCASRNDGALDRNNGHYTDYRESLNDAIRTAPRAIRFKHSPRVNRMKKEPTWKMRSRTSNDT